MGKIPLRLIRWSFLVAFSLLLSPHITRFVYAQPSVKLPWDAGVAWYYTAGPHRGWIYDGNAYSAVDFATPTRDVLAAAAGTVIYSGWRDDLGNIVGIDHGNGWATWYAHLESRYVSAFALVSQGQPIGYAGATGWGAYGQVHLHFTVTLNAKDYSINGFQISGWTIHSSGAEYQGTMTKSGEQDRTADEQWATACVGLQFCDVYAWGRNDLISDNPRQVINPTPTNTPITPEPTAIPTSTSTSEPRYSVSGYVTGPEGPSNPISGASVSISTAGYATTDGNGYYYKGGLPAGTYTLIPSKPGYHCGPEKQVTLPPDRDQVNFTCTPIPPPPRYHIAGYVTGPAGGADPKTGIRVEIRSLGRSTNTDHNGRYIFEGLSGGLYKVAPNDDRYDFGPACKWVTIPDDQGHSRDDVNFTLLPDPLPGVALYEHDQYKGMHETFGGDILDLSNSCIGDNVATSLKIRGPYIAILYRDPNYQGTSETFTGDDPQLGDNVIGNDTVSSIWVMTSTPTPTTTPSPTPTNTATATSPPTQTPSPPVTPCSTLQGDFDCNCEITAADIMMIADYWRCQDGDGCYDETLDVNHDGEIDIIDVMEVVEDWGQTCLPPYPPP